MSRVDSQRLKSCKLTAEMPSSCHQPRAQYKGCLTPALGCFFSWNTLVGVCMCVCVIPCVVCNMCLQLLKVLLWSCPYVPVWTIMVAALIFALLQRGTAMNIFALRDDKYSPHLISAPSAMSASSSEMTQAWSCALLCLIKRSLVLYSMSEGVESVFAGYVFMKLGIILLEQQFFMGLVSVFIIQMFKIYNSVLQPVRYISLSNLTIIF